MKRNLAHTRSAQTKRLRELQRQVNEEARVDGPDGPSWIVESNVPYASYWTLAEPHLRRALTEGSASWVPTLGIGVMFTSWRAAASLGLAAAEAAHRGQQEAASEAMGSGEYRIIVRSHDYPYRSNWAAPISIFPVAPDLAAMMLTNDVLVTVEVHIEALMDALRATGLEPRNLLVGLSDRDRLPARLIAWRSSSGGGAMHRGAIEQLGIELTDIFAWAAALATTARPSTATGRWRSSVCLADEGKVWA